MIAFLQSCAIGLAHQGGTQAALPVAGQDTQRLHVHRAATRQGKQKTGIVSAGRLRQPDQVRVHKRPDGFVQRYEIFLRYFLVEKILGKAAR